MYEPILIAPSILSSDFMHLGDEVASLAEAGADYVHVDVMDGHFVPNLTIGVPVLKQLVKASPLPCDVHLMIDNPLTELPWFLEAHAALYTLHREALDDDRLAEGLALIHEAGAMAGVALKPKTPVMSLKPVIELVDMVLVMSVEPGFSGQSYIAGSEVKVAETVAMANAHGASPLIQVDGGISSTTAPLVAAAGADFLVSGKTVFSAPDRAAEIAGLRVVADEARLRGRGQGA